MRQAPAGKSAARVAAPGGLFDGLAFSRPFRKYQRLILAAVEQDAAEDNKYHIVAPPGAGKTIIGLELIRRFGAPAVVFTPTTTIQQQWQEQFKLFGAPERIVGLMSTDPARLAPINIFTYQVISTPAEAQAYARALATERWVADLLAEGQAADEAAARDRLAVMARSNPRAYDQERARRYARVKRSLLRQEEADVGAFLHPNARALIRRLLDAGVRTVVLDECHHLLDYWAIVLRYLIAQIPDPRIVGLTATLPDPEDEREYENYTSLLGEVDFEVPTPAVVKEGDLAPYRDLVYFVQPSPRERVYLHDIQQAFEEGTAELTASEPFQGWVVRSVLERPGALGWPIPWAEFLTSHPLLAQAGLRLLKRIAYSLPPDLPVPQEADDPLTLDDWLVLLERYALDVLKLSAAPADHAALARLRQTLLPFGLTLTERGLRQGRSAGDLVLALSESKDAAVAEILAREAADLNGRLRAVVVTDFERMASGVQGRLAGVLERDAGSAIRVFRRLVADPRTAPLQPILVTGRTLLIGVGSVETLTAEFDRYLAGQGHGGRCVTRPGPADDVLAVTAEGGEWASRIYVRMVTAAFDAGVSRCLVGTRGIFGEGWDSLGLNTLIDLTSTTTSTAVQQLRGRSLRLDPAWPGKVAHNWDVICVAPEFERGDRDLRRFRQRHARYWGIVAAGTPGTLRRLATRRDAPGPEAPAGAPVMKGVAHVDPDLAFQLATWHFAKIDLAPVTERMLTQIGQRAESYALWAVGAPYENLPIRAARVQPGALQLRTVYTINRTFRRMAGEFRASLAVATVWVATGIASGAFLGVLSAPLLAVLLGALAWNGRAAYRLARSLAAQPPAESILQDVSRALLIALQDAGQIDAALPREAVRLVALPGASYEVLLDGATPRDGATFVRALEEVFGPVRDPRYLIRYDDRRLPDAWAPLWAVLRDRLTPPGGYPPAYYPVPEMLATHKERAAALARAWQEYVGGGELVFTRSEAGRLALLLARAQRRPPVRSLAFDLWR